jgi:hypothetical protein
MNSHRRVNSTVMRLEQSFHDAVASFRNFLKENGHPTEILWVFRDDLWQCSQTEVLVRYPTSSENFVLAQKVFGEGCEKGLVDIYAVAIAADQVATTVWFPKFAGEDVQGWDCGMKLSIAQPLPRARIVNPLRWWFFRFAPRFRHYQNFEWTVRSKRWAAA